MNSERFLTNQRLYFSGAYQQFCAFGGPCVYFHRQCLLAREREFLSNRHIEMLYATPAAWGTHWMGGTETTKTKLTEWEQFSNSLKGPCTIRSTNSGVGDAAVTGSVTA